MINNPGNRPRSLTRLSQAEALKVWGVLLMACAVLMLFGLVASGIRTSGYWPWTRMTPTELGRRAGRVAAAAPFWVGAAFLCLTAGTFVISHYNWLALVFPGCFGVTQVAFVTWSLRQARQRAARLQARRQTSRGQDRGEPEVSG